MKAASNTAVIGSRTNSPTDGVDRVTSHNPMRRSTIQINGSPIRNFRRSLTSLSACQVRAPMTQAVRAAALQTATITFAIDSVKPSSRTTKT